MFYLVLIEQFIINNALYEDSIMNKNDLEQKISGFYEEFLLRKPDKTGLYYFVSMIENGESTIDDVKKLITKSENNSTYEEGCLSVPGQFAEVDRPDQCHVNYLDYNGQKKELKAEGLLATCIQHEMDHLEGILFIDYLSKLKRNFIVKKLSKQKKALERIVV